MPKSPHPGHQSTCWSVLYSCRLNLRAGAASGMGDHHLRLPLAQGPLHAFHELVAAKGPAVVLEDPVGRLDTGLLAYQGAQLGGEVALDQDDAPRPAEDGADLLERKRPHHPDLQEVDPPARALELGERVQDRALG